MNINIAVTSKTGKLGKTTLLTWLANELEKRGATVVGTGEHSITVVADTEFLQPVPQFDKSVEPAKTLLQQAHEIIHGDREQTYGDPGKNLTTIAAYWSTHLTATTGEKITLTPQDVCGMMILLKQARLANSPTHRDSLLDIAGYAGLQDLISPPY